MPFGKLQAGCHVPFTEEWLPSGHYHKGLIGGVLQRWLSFWMEATVSLGTFNAAEMF